MLADVELSGTGRVPAFDSLSVNNGRIALVDHAILTTAPSYTSADGTPHIYSLGILDVSFNSAFYLQGDMILAGSSQPFIRVEDSPVFASFVNITGTLYLRALGTTTRFDADLVPGYNRNAGE